MPNLRDRKGSGDGTGRPEPRESRAEAAMEDPPSWIISLAERQERDVKVRDSEMRSFMQQVLGNVEKLCNSVRQTRSSVGIDPVDLSASTSSTPTLRENSETGVVKTVYVASPPSRPEFREKHSNPVLYLEEVEAYCDRVDASAEQRLVLAIDGLTGAPRDWAELTRKGWTSYADFKLAFLKTYWSKVEQFQLRNALATIKWDAQEGDTMHAHFVKWARKASLLTQPMEEAELVMTLMPHFPSEIRSLWAVRPLYTIPEVADFLRRQDELRPYGGAKPTANCPAKKPRLELMNPPARGPGFSGNGIPSKPRP